ncbi:glycoside hydrolase family 79 protein [Roridomyces roridus]|uniref:Glycoside hydrolase family 79 protein n=1 Tax=Roridomyces roridus TaxID=1738132 RepID=A0AAD7FYK2_9AGAR|nr:glycoside hydrolase family 79 protein [Roridomyces roridus]
MLGGLLLASLLPFASAIQITIPLGSDNAVSVDGNLMSLSIEQDRWLDWSGSTSGNSFFSNTLNNLVTLTGDAPTVRIGANSEDHTDYADAPAALFVQEVFPPSTPTNPYPEATAIVAGPGFYEARHPLFCHVSLNDRGKAAQFLPSGTGVTWGVNFGGRNLTAVYLETQAIVGAFDNLQDTSLDFLELGNEADLYKNNKLRASNYNVAEYTTEWIQFATNMSLTAGLNCSDTRILGASFAGSSHLNASFSPQGIFANGILDSYPGQFISTISQHHYSGSFCSGSGGLLQDLMTKSTIRSNLSSFIPDIEATQALGLDYLFGETNSYSCHGAPGVSNTAGAALWALDYALFGTQIGISRMYFHQGIGFKYNFIQPVTLNRSILDGSNLASPQQPHIQPAYYAAIIAAEAIGSNSDAGRSVLEVNVNDSRIAGYAFYEGDQLARAVFINSLAFFNGATNRSSTHIDLSFTGSDSAPTSFSVKRLVIGFADDVSSVTWGGQSYETPDGRISGSPAEEKGTVAEGIDIPATQAVMLTFGSS